jgi:hypothetical protein
MFIKGPPVVTTTQGARKQDPSSGKLRPTVRATIHQGNCFAVFTRKHNNVLAEKAHGNGTLFHAACLDDGVPVVPMAKLRQIRRCGRISTRRLNPLFLNFTF